MRQASLLALLVVVAACASGGQRPTFQREYRGLGSQTRAVWFGVLSTRYGCDTVSVKMYGLPGPDAGVTVCQVARYVQPEVVRVWVGSMGIREEWEYRLGAQGPGWNGTPPWSHPGAVCRVVLAGPTPPSLRVTDITC